MTRREYREDGGGGDRSREKAVEEGETKARQMALTNEEINRRRVHLCYGFFFSWFNLGLDFYPVTVKKKNKSCR